MRSVEEGVQGDHVQASGATAFARSSSTFNLRTDHSELSDVERHAFERLFDVVVFFSPYPADRASYPGHKSEQEVQAAALAARHALVAESTQC